MSKLRDLRGHFTQISDCVLEPNDFLTKDYEVLTYITLCKFANKHTDASFPSQETLAKYIRGSVSSVRRALAKLEEEGLIQIIAQFDKTGGQTSNLYVLLPIPDKFIKVVTQNTPPVLEEQPPQSEGTTNYTQLSTLSIVLNNISVALPQLLEVAKEKASALDKENHTYSFSDNFTMLFVESVLSTAMGKEVLLVDTVNEEAPYGVLLYDLLTRKDKYKGLTAKSLAKVLITYTLVFNKVPLPVEVDQMAQDLATHLPSLLSRAIRNAKYSQYEGDYDEGMRPFIAELVELDRLNKQKHIAEKQKQNARPSEHKPSTPQPSMRNFGTFDDF